MGPVVADLSMSLDGFIADPSDGVAHIFDWYDNGEVTIEWPGNDMVSHVTEASAAVLRDTIANAGAIVAGRRVFDITDGWAGGIRSAVTCSSSPTIRPTTGPTIAA